LSQSISGGKSGARTVPAYLPSAIVHPPSFLQPTISNTLNDVTNSL
jgi:hypothetical protein